MFSRCALELSCILKFQIEVTVHPVLHESEIDYLLVSRPTRSPPLQLPQCFLHFRQSEIFSKGISIHRTCCQTPCQIIATDPSPHVLSQHIQRRYRAGMVAHLQQVALLVSSKKLHHDPSRSPFSWGEGGQSSTVPTTSAGASSSFAPSTLPTYCSSSSTKPCDLSLEITSSTSCQS